MRTQRRSEHLNGNKRRRLLQGVEARRPPEHDLPLGTRLEALAEALHPTDMDELWVFPPLPNRGGASEFLLVTSYEVESESHRRVLTAHVEAEFEDDDGTTFSWVQRVQDVGPVPHDWLESLPDSLLGRFAEAGVPEVLEVSGRPEAWAEIVARFSGANGSGSGNGNGS